MGGRGSCRAVYSIRNEKRLSGSFALPAHGVLLFRFDDRPAGVVAAIRANDMRGLHRAALRAGLKLLRLESIVRTPHPGPRVRLFTFGNTHDSPPSYDTYRALCYKLLRPINLWRTGLRRQVRPSFSGHFTLLPVVQWPRINNNPSSGTAAAFRFDDTIRHPGFKTEEPR